MADALYLLDGYSVIYRSYFAFIRNPMRNPRGENSSAVFGFTNSLVSLFRQYSPSHCAVVLDSIGPTFRHEMYPEYKATREKTPDDLHAQVPVIESILDALGVPTVRRDGFEADDIMATLAYRCREQGMQCTVVTGDKDLLQLVDGPVTILKPGKRGTERMDRDAVYRDWNVYPEQILDYLSLVGDSSDNVPGVAGIGPKTASRLLAEFSTLDNLYDNLERVSTKGQRTRLEEGRDSAFLSRRLITLVTDVPLDRGPDDFRLPPLDFEAAAPILRDQGMTGLLRDLGLSEAGPTARPALSGAEELFPAGTEEPGGAGSSAGAVHERVRSVNGYLPPQNIPRSVEESAAVCDESVDVLSGRGTYELADSLDVLDRWISLCRDSGTFAFDSETTSVDPMEADLVGFSLSPGVGTACYVPLTGPDGPVLEVDQVRERLKALLEDPSCSVVGQNIKYDYTVLFRWGVRIANVAFDTMVAAWLIDSASGGYGMDKLAQRYLSYRTIHFADLFEGNAKGRTFTEVPLDQAATYAAEDADITFRLYRVFEPLLARRGVAELFSGMEMPLVPVLANMEMEGIKLDVAALSRYSRELEQEIAAVRDEIFSLVGHEFNVASTQQLQQVLFSERGLQPIKKTKTGFSTDNNVLQELAREDPVPQRILRYRQLAKLRSTYVEALPGLVNPETGRIHTDYHQTGTATGRLSSTDPNLQNIPIRDEEGRRIRTAFVARPGWSFVSADYAQIELVILAHLSADQALSRAFTDGEDVHRRTAALIFGVDPADVSSEQRRIAKTINFGVMYGMSAFRLSNELGIPRKDAQAFIDSYFGTYQGIRRFIDATVRGTEEAGEVRTIAGRPRPIPDINNRNRTIKSAAERVAVNTPIQGSAADIVKKAMLAVAAGLAEKGLSARLLLQVHDELIVECPDAEVQAVAALLTDTMTSVARLDVPLRVSVESGRNWGDMHG